MKLKLLLACAMMLGSLSQGLQAQCTISQTGLHPFGFITSGSIGQSFKADCSGAMDSLKLFIAVPISGTTISVYEGNGTSGTLLGSINGVNLASSMDSTDLKNIDLSSAGIRVKKDSTYTVISSIGNYIMFSNSNRYGNGTLYDNGVPQPGADLLFKAEISAVASLFSAAITASTNVGCNGDSTGALTVTVVDGMANYSYSWSNGASTSATASTSNTITGLKAGSYTVTITDGNLDVATASATITQATVLSAGLTVDSNINCGSGSAGLTADPTGGTAPYTYLWSNAATTASIAGVGPGAYSVTVTDDNGCSVTAWDTIVSGTDLINPTAYAQNIYAYLDGNGQASITATQVDSGSYDNCGIASLTLDKYNFGCADLGSNNVTLTVADNAGNISTANAVVNVVDTMPPSIQCKDVSVYLDAAGLVSIDTTDVLQSMSDNCSLAGAFINFSQFYCGNAFNGLARDSTIISQSQITSTGGSASQWQSWTSTVNGLLNSVAVKHSNPNSFFNTPMQMELYEGTGTGGTLLATATNTQIVNSSTGYKFYNYSFSNVEIETGKKYTWRLYFLTNQTRNWLPYKALDVYAGGRASTSPTEDFYFEINASKYKALPNIVAVTAVDMSGNSRTCNAEVTVIDTVRPVAFAKNHTAYLNKNGTVTVSGNALNNNSTDNCSIWENTLSQSTFTCADIGANPVTFYTEDRSENIDSATATITVLDTVGPTLGVKDITAYLDASGQVTLNVADIDTGTTDACGLDTLFLDTFTFGCADRGANPVVITARDVNGNTSSKTIIITVEDTLAPTLATQNITVYLDASGLATITAADVDNGTTDGCGIDTLAMDTYDFTCAEVGAQPVMFYATDVEGNMDSVSVTATVADTVGPDNKVNLALTVYLDSMGQASITVADVDTGTTDACGIDTLFLNLYDFTCANAGVQPLVFSSVDVNGNVSSTAITVNVMDTISPELGVNNSITVYLDVAGTASITAADYDTATSDECGIDTLILDTYSFGCAQVGTQNVMFTAIDNNGNSSSQVVTAIVMDTLSPLLAVQNINVYLDATGQATIAAADVDNGTADACGIDTLILDNYNFSCSEIGVNTVVLTATDLNANTASAPVTVTVIDTISPVIAAQNVTLYLDASGQVTATAADVDNGTTDACGIDTLILNAYNFSCADTGAQNIAFTAIDVNGNSSTASVTATVVDTVSPALAVQTVAVYLNASGMAFITAADVDNGTTDACSIDTLILDKYNFTCANQGVQSVVFTAIDVNGNSASTMALVNVMDTLTATVNVQNSTVYLNASGMASITLADVDNGSADACGLDTLYLDTYTFGCSQIGVNPVVLTAIDVNGHVSMDTAQVTVVDTISPVVAVQNITVYLNASNQAVLTAADIDNGTTDACGIDTLMLDNYVFGCSATPYSVTFTAIDVNGNSSVATATVTIADTIVPTVSAQNVTIYLDASGQASVAVADIDNGTTDACGVDTLFLDAYDFTCANAGARPVVLTAMDINGNMGTATATVMVLDTINPVAVAQNVTAYLDASGQATIAAADVDMGSSDVCGIDTLILSQYQFSCAEVGANTVTLNAADAGGNTASATATVAIIDTISPVLNVQNITAYINGAGVANISAADVDNGTADACGIDTLILSNYNFSCSDLGANTVNITATDVNGNTASTTVTVTVADTIKPIVVSKDVTVYLDIAGQASITIGDIENGSTDGCGIAGYSLSKYNFTCSDIGANPVVLSVTDIFGTIGTDTAIVTVLDTLGVVANAHNITVYLDQSGTVTVPANAVVNGSSNQCGTIYSLSQSTFDCSETGLNLVTFTISNNGGTADSAQVFITVKDTVSPKLALRHRFTVSLDQFGNASLGASQLDSASTDNCTNFLYFAASKTAFTCADLGDNPVTVTVWDAKNNTTTGTAIVRVVDYQAPAMATRNATVYLDANGQAAITPAMIDNGSTDNCQVDSLWLDKTTFSCTNVGQNIVKLYAQDAHGNIANANAVVNLLDTVKPTINNLPATITKYANANQCAVSVQWPAITGSDNCGAGNVTVSQGNGTLFSTGTTTVNVTLADGSGNITAAAFNVIVLDTIAPVVSNVPTGYTQVATAGSCSAPVFWSEPLAVDNCSGITWGKSHLPGALMPVGNTTVTYTATDASNNSTTVNFVVTVVDQMAPTIANIPANITATAAAGSCSAVVHFTMPTALDNCSGASIVSSDSSGSTFPIGNTVVTFTAVDSSNNMATASFTITVEDKEMPIITSMPANDTIGACNAVFTYAKPTAADNCGNVTVTQTAGLPSGTVFPYGVTQNAFRISDGNGNDTTVIFSVMVVPAQLPTLPSQLELCEGSGVQQLALGQNINWKGKGTNNIGTVFDPATAGPGRHKLDYTFIDNRGCTTIGSIYITVFAQPVTPVVTKMASTTLTTGNYISYQWYRDGVAIPGATGQNFSYTQGGNYQVMVGNSAGCTNFSKGTVVGTSGGGIGIEENLFGNLELYPNPSKGDVIIDLNRANRENLEVVVFNTAGMKVYERKDQTSQVGRVTLDLSFLSDGTYLLHIRSGSEVVVKRVVLY